MSKSLKILSKETNSEFSECSLQYSDLGRKHLLWNTPWQWRRNGEVKVMTTMLSSDHKVFLAIWHEPNFINHVIHYCWYGRIDFKEHCSSIATETKILFSWFRFLNYIRSIDEHLFWAPYTWVSWDYLSTSVWMDGLLLSLKA